MYREVMATVQAEAECLTFASFVEGSEEMHRLLPLFKAVSPFEATAPRVQTYSRSTSTLHSQCTTKTAGLLETGENWHCAFLALIVQRPYAMAPAISPVLHFTFQIAHLPPATSQTACVTLKRDTGLQAQRVVWDQSRGTGGKGMETWPSPFRWL